MRIAVLFSDANRVEFLEVEDELLVNPLSGSVSSEDVAKFLKSQGLDGSSFFTFTKGDIIIRNHYFGKDIADNVTHSVEESELKKKAASTPKGLKLNQPTDWSEIVSDVKDEQRVLACIMRHDPLGYAVASCGYLLVWDRRAYEEQHKGKCYFVRPFNGCVKGVEYKCERGDIEDIPTAKFNWASFTSMTDERKEDIGFRVSMANLYNIVSERFEALKEQHKKDLTNGTIQKGLSFKKYASGSYVRGRIMFEVESIGKVSFVLSTVQKFLRAAAALSIDDEVTLRFTSQKSRDERYPDMAIARIEAEHGGALMTGSVLDEKSTEELFNPNQYGNPDVRFTFDNEEPQEAYAEHFDNDEPREEESDGMDLL